MIGSGILPAILASSEELLSNSTIEKIGHSLRLVWTAQDRTFGRERLRQCVISHRLRPSTEDEERLITRLRKSS